MTTLYEQFAEYFENNGFDDEDGDVWFEQMELFAKNLPHHEKIIYIEAHGGEDTVRQQLSGAFTDEALSSLEGLLFCLLQEGMSVCF